MSVIRTTHDKDHPYVMTARGVAQNKAVSYEALGMLNYLLSKPDDWKVDPEDLTRTNCGRDKVYKLLKELKEAGHIVQERTEAQHDKPPMWGERVVVEQPYPELKDTALNPSLPDTAQPDTANARYGKTALTNQEKKETNQRKELNNTTTPARTRKDFDDVPKPDRLDIIHAWAENLSIKPVNVYNRDAYHSAAADIFRDGYRAGQVALFVKAKMQDDYWLGKTLSLAKVGELMPQWLMSLKNGNGKHTSATPKPEPQPYVSPGVDMNAIVAQMERDGDNDPRWTPPTKVTQSTGAAS